MKVKKISGNNITAKVKSQFSSPQTKTTPKKNTKSRSMGGDAVVTGDNTAGTFWRKK
tara:strand:+ start:158 stop:328 length:171 start_codon:yes stop_codon:yes gene_type:complete